MGNYIKDYIKSFNRIIIKKIMLIILLNLVLINVTGCKENSEDLINKLTEELNYLDNKIIVISNQLNNIALKDYTISKEVIQMDENNSLDINQKDEEQSKTNSQELSSTQKENNTTNVTKMDRTSILETDKEEIINWNSIKNEIDILNNSWTVVYIDLTSANINNDDILGFSKALDETIIYVKEENKEKTLNSLIRLYSFIPIFEEQINQNKSISKIKQTKLYLLNSYNFIETKNWEEIKKNVDFANNTFENIIVDEEFIKNREYKVNKTEVLIQELKNSLMYKDKNLFLLKYKNLIENLNTL